MLSACAVLTLAGCDVIPSSGPLVKEVVRESQAAKRYGFTLVDVDGGVLDAMKAAPHQGLRANFTDDGPIVPMVGPGDTLSITIFESGIDELFSPPAAQQLTYGTNRITLPNATVDRSGMIAVPFAGLVKVGGLTPLRVRAAIESRLLRKAVTPQVLVSVVNNVTNVVTLTGAIKNPGRYGLTPASETLLQMIAMAGGSTGLDSDTIVHLTRGMRQVSIRLSDLMAHPQDDIHAWPGDFLNLTIDPRNFLIYGAVAQAGAYSLAVDDVTLAQAISRAGGLRDFQADSRGIFLFRYGIRQQTPVTKLLGALAFATSRAYIQLTHGPALPLCHGPEEPKCQQSI
ncbi:MAG TPA: polysaccharide biosynthesis/export family protein [Tepidisphaeraceae bacterium]|nr:polysaccharide biosynthesis/export family protein [Tepidisphaeraceae bacterium]